MTELADELLRWAYVLFELRPLAVAIAGTVVIALVVGGTGLVRVRGTPSLPRHRTLLPVPPRALGASTFRSPDA